MPSRRDDDYDDPPRRDDRDDDRPRRRPRGDDGPPKAGGVGKLLLILLVVGGGGMLLCCGICAGVGYYMMGRQVTVVDASRTKNAQGGTATVKVNVRMSGDNPGGFFKGDFYFNFKSGSRTASFPRGLIAVGGGRGPAEYSETFSTPELAAETGPVIFWVERRDGDTIYRVSPEHTIP